MAKSIKVFPKILLSAFAKRIDFTESGKMYLMLLGSAPATSVQYVSEIRAKEIAQGSGYVTDGAVVTTCAMAYTTDENGDYVTFTHDNVIFADAAFTCTYGVLYYKGSTDAASPVFLLFDFDGLQTPDTEDFVVECPSGAAIATLNVVEH